MLEKCRKVTRWHPTLHRTRALEFGIIARHNRFDGRIGAFLPHTARERRHNAGVICDTKSHKLVY